MDIALVDGVYYTELEDGFMVNIEDGIAPIELTDEWLAEFGAAQESMSLCFKAIRVGGSVLNINPDNGVAWIMNGVNMINLPQLIQHVHQQTANKHENNPLSRRNHHSFILHPERKG
jgi:hypothetical protein